MLMSASRTTHMAKVLGRQVVQPERGQPGLDQGVVEEVYIGRQGRHCVVKRLLLVDGDCELILN